MKYYTTIFVLLLLLSGFACKENPPELEAPNFQLLAADVGVTEAWLQVISVQTAGPKTLMLLRDGDTILITQFSGLDTILYDGSLLPKHSYVYNTMVSSTMPFLRATAELAVTTVDTTSHNFTWQIDTLGDGNSSALYDVAIINDTLAYAVGEMYKKDSAGNFDPDAYNIAKWNGRHWTLSRILVRDYGSIRGYYRLKCVYAFAPNDIWVAGDADIIQWDGLRWISKAFVMTDLSFNGQIMKMWGTDDSNLYLVGRGGAIYHYDGNMWRKLVSGTTLDIQDIWGDRNGLTGDWEIIAVAANPFSSSERKILRISGTTVSTISDSGINWPLNSIWFLPCRHYYAVGSGIYEKHLLSELQWKNEPLEITTYYTNRIRGTEINDVFFCGAYGDFFHYNGISWNNYRSATNLANGEYLSVAVKGNKVFTVGYESPRAVIAQGTRIVPLR